MDLKSTKATQAPITEKKSKSAGLVCTTEKAFATSANSSKANNFQERGLAAEMRAWHYFESRQFRLLRHRYRSPFGEVDLVLRDPEGGLCLIEVKTLRNADFLATRVKRGQSVRLRRILTWFLEREPRCRLMLAVVDSQNEVLVFDDVFR